MVDGRPSHLLRQLHLAFAPSAEVTDGQLLESFVVQHNEAAFETLVRRHAPMVLGVCRRMLRNHHDAEDAFQATFLVLVRKAAGLCGRAALGNWLYGVAHHTALKARAAQVRRRFKEREKTMHASSVALSPEPNDWLPLLDEALKSLPDRYRQAIIVCDLEGKSRADAARLLGWREGTLSGRLARARMLLAKRLTHRGVTLSGGAVVTALTTQAATSASPLLIVHTVQAALVAAHPLATTGGPSASVVLLAEGVIQSMLMTKVKVVAALALTVTVLGAGAGALRLAGADDAGKAPENPARAKAALIPGLGPVRQDKDIEMILNRVVTVSYNSTPLRKALEDISAAVGMNIVLDHRAFNDMGENVDRPITLKLENVKLRTALHFMLKELGLGYAVQQGVLVVTGESESGGLVTKVHPVRDLVTGKDNKPLQDDLIRLITNVVEARTWTHVGGRGTIEYYPLSDSLIINQAPDVQEQIEALLTGLRAFKKNAR
jgi:RNA polymerase sigma factor (sigma-70 family)